MMLNVASKSANDEIIAVAVRDVLAELTGCVPKDILLSTELVSDLGIDSFLFVELLGLLEERLRTPFPRGGESHLTSANNVGEFIERLVALLEDRG